MLVRLDFFLSFFFGRIYLCHSLFCYCYVDVLLLCCIFFYYLFLLLFFYSGWLEPLLDRIARNKTTVVCPVIDVIDDTTMEYHWRDSGGVNVGGFDWNLQFNWHAVPERERKRHKVTFCSVFLLC